MFAFLALTCPADDIFVQTGNFSGVAGPCRAPEHAISTWRLVREMSRSRTAATCDLRTCEMRRACMSPTNGEDGRGSVGQAGERRRSRLFSTQDIYRTSNSRERRRLGRHPRGAG